jgi:hypothetical protein
VERAKQRIEFHLEKLRQKVGKAQDQKAADLNPHAIIRIAAVSAQSANRGIVSTSISGAMGHRRIERAAKLASGKKIGHHFILQLRGFIFYPPLR